MIDIIFVKFGTGKIQVRDNCSNILCRNVIELSVGRFDGIKVIRAANINFILIK